MGGVSPPVDSKRDIRSVVITYLQRIVHETGGKAKGEWSHGACSQTAMSKRGNLMNVG